MADSLVPTDNTTQPVQTPISTPMPPAPMPDPMATTPVSDSDAAAATVPAAPAVPANVVPFPLPPLGETGGVQPAGNAKYKVLVVEDEPDARTMFVDLLASEGYDVSSAVDGIDALAKAASEKFNLILLDIVMPNKDGVEVLQDIKSDTAKFGTPVVVMLTNISGDAAVEKAMELGAAGYKLKIGTEPEDLLNDVASFLQGKIQDVKVEPISSQDTSPIKAAA